PGQGPSRRLHRGRLPDPTRPPSRADGPEDLVGGAFVTAQVVRGGHEDVPPERSVQTIANALAVCEIGPGASDARTPRAARAPGTGGAAPRATPQRLPISS